MTADRYQRTLDAMLAAAGEPDYGTAMDRVEARIRAAAVGAGDWEGQLRAGLAAVLEICEREPQLGRALLVEVHGGGAAELARRGEALRRAAGFLERGRGEGAREPSALTPEATVAGIQAVLIRRLTSGAGGFDRLLGELMYVAILPYLGAAAAAAALAAG